MTQHTETPKRNFKTWGELTYIEREKAQARARFVGYATTELDGLLYEFDGDKLKAIKDNNLLSGVFSLKQVENK